MKDTYQEIHFDQIAEAIRFVYGTDVQIPAVDFYKWIRALKSMIGEGDGITGECRLRDNIPEGCGDIHGLLFLDCTLVNCVLDKMRDPKMTLEHMCLIDDNWSYGLPVCNNLHGLLLLDFNYLVDHTISEVTLWGYYNDASI